MFKKRKVCVPMCACVCLCVPVCMSVCVCVCVCDTHRIVDSGHLDVGEAGCECAHVADTAEAGKRGAEAVEAQGSRDRPHPQQRRRRRACSVPYLAANPPAPASPIGTRTQGHRGARTGQGRRLCVCGCLWPCVYAWVCMWVRRGARVPWPVTDELPVHGAQGHRGGLGVGVPHKRVRSVAYPHRATVVRPTCRHTHIHTHTHRGIVRAPTGKRYMRLSTHRQMALSAHRCKQALSTHKPKHLYTVIQRATSILPWSRRSNYLYLSRCLETYGWRRVRWAA
jgi:hypothetical protein